MNILVISGSHRSKSESEKVANVTIGYLKELDPTLEVSLFKLANNPLPLWDETAPDKDPKWEKVWKPVSLLFQAADGFVVISPEWHGMAPAGLKNLFLLTGNKECAHKPALLVGVSSGMSGTYPIAELRMSSFKNNRICYIPDHVIIRHAPKVLNHIGQPESPEDDYIQKRLKYSCDILIEYTKALKAVRNSPKINFKDYPNGL